MQRTSVLILSLLIVLPVLAENPRAEFWKGLETLCGKAFRGTLVEAPPGDSFEGKDLVMHVRECRDDQIRIPFFVGDDRSRTWVISRTESGLRLKHDHRHEDGTEDEITWYGGDTQNDGTEEAQRFHADEHTIVLIPAASTNVWTVEVLPVERFTYALVRVGTDRRFRVDFDLTKPIEAPPPPWGWEENAE